MFDTPALLGMFISINEIFDKYRVTLRMFGIPRWLITSMDI